MGKKVCEILIPLSINKSSLPHKELGGLACCLWCFRTEAKLCSYSRQYGLQSQRFWLSGPLLKKFAEPYPGI